MTDDISERLREAACIGDIHQVAKLREQGADINSQNRINGWTALHWACKRNHEKVVLQLLDSGANKAITNNDGHIPAQLTTNENIKRALEGGELESVKPVSLPIVPNYIAHPVFPYAQKDEKGTINAQTALPPRIGDGDNRFSPYGSRRSPNARESFRNIPQVGYVDPDELVLKARLANSDDRDFIEIELSRSDLTYTSLKDVICSELGVDQGLVAKIRKLPDTVLRKDKDVWRLVDFQEIELVLTNKAISQSSRTYNGGFVPLKNSETILY